MTERPPGPEGSGADSPEGSERCVVQGEPPRAPSGAWCRVGGGALRLSGRLGPSA